MSPSKSEHIPKLTTDDAIEAYLQSKGYSVTSVKELTGGTANFVWRATDECGNTFVVKHAEPYVKNNADVPFRVERMAFEATSMSTAGKLLSDLKKELHVSPPEVLAHDLDANILIMSDGRGDHLKARYSQLSTDQVLSIGERLGKWLATLHERSAAQNISIGPGGNPIAKAIYQYAYHGLQPALAGYNLGGVNGELGKVVNEKFGSLLQTDDACVAMGDFWPGNIILSNDSREEALIDIMVVDWEMCRRGVAATDVAQFTAEAYLLDRFSGSSHGLAKAFLDSYLAAATISDSFERRFLVHWAVHVIFWPIRVQWARKDELKKVAEYGVKALEVAMQDNDNVVQQFMRELRSSLGHSGHTVA